MGARAPHQSGGRGLTSVYPCRPTMAGMDMMEIAAQLVAMRMAGTQQAAQMAMLKKNHEMEMSLVNMIAEAAKSAPAPAGQGLVVDKRA